MYLIYLIQIRQFYKSYQYFYDCEQYSYSQNKEWSQAWLYIANIINVQKNQFMAKK